MNAIRPAPIVEFWPAARASLGRHLLLALFASLMMWASAKVQVPFWPVPITMQTALVLLVGAFYGPRLGATAMALYLAEGAAGLPVFAGTPERGIGLAYMAGPTAGYLVGFVLAAALVGWGLTRTRRPLAILGVMLLGAVVIDAAGLAWLSALLGPAKAVRLGLLPFAIGDGLKVLLASALTVALLRPQQR